MDLEKGGGDRKGRVRFGHFLKKLRVESRLTLEQVEQLSIPYDPKISIAYLSRGGRPGASREW